MLVSRFSSQSVEHQQCIFEGRKGGVFSVPALGNPSSIVDCRSRCFLGLFSTLPGPNMVVEITSVSLSLSPFSYISFDFAFESAAAVFVLGSLTLKRGKSCSS